MLFMEKKFKQKRRLFNSLNKKIGLLFLVFVMVLFCNKSNRDITFTKQVLFELSTIDRIELSDSILHVTPLDTEIVNVMTKSMLGSNWEYALARFVDSDTVKRWSSMLGHSFIFDVNKKNLKKRDSCTIIYSRIGYDSNNGHGIIKYSFVCNAKSGARGYLLFKFCKNCSKQIEVVEDLVFSED